MSNYHEFLIDFMDSKANKLKRMGIKKSLYFNAEDKCTIARWGKSDAQRVVRALVSCESSTYIGLFSGTCPFCLYITDCLTCSYASNHGYCSNHGNSDFGTICRIIGHEGFTKFTPAYYKSVIKRLKEKHNIK